MLRTKSIDFEFLKSSKSSKIRDRVIVSPSLIPEEFIKKYEPTNHSLKERLEALRELADSGYKIFPCFSPLIYDPDSWRETIKNFVQTFKTYLPPEKIHYYTLGTLRLSRMALRNIKMIHPESDIDSLYFVNPKNTSGDKFRYPKIIRTEMYSFFIREMNKNGYENVSRFLQTETVEAWKALLVEKFSDLKLDMKRYESGELDTKALAFN